MKKKGIVGAGGFGREIYWSLSMMERIGTVFFVNDEYYDGKDPLVKPLSTFNPTEYELVIAIADSNAREKIVNSLPPETEYFTHIHPSAQIHGPDVEIGEGSIVCAGTIITANVKIGKHAHLNLITTIGHDNIIGDYFTTAPGTQISGNCEIGDRVYFGTRSCNRQKTKICSDVTVGMNSGILDSITEPGVYVGTPAKKIK
jgi:sugar O-acyltransferase (sialic acid O-acetyltransferase NeuD family)